MKRNNRLAILSTLLWVVIFGIVFFTRFPAEDVIAQSVQATLQARAEIPSPVISPEFSGDSQVYVSKGATAQIAEINALPTDPSDPCLYAKLAAETVPDGTEVKAGAVFTKTWVIENTGACTWTSAYQLVFSGGEQMGSPESILIGHAVLPGERVAISVNLTAPYENGSARSIWNLSTDTGLRFGKIWAEIDIVD